MTSCGKPMRRSCVACVAVTICLAVALLSIVYDGHVLKLMGTNTEEPKKTKAIGNIQTTKKDDDDDDPRPWLVLHVGPPKTGTTTIQKGLEELAPRLARDDNVYFMGVTLFEIKTVAVETEGEAPGTVTMFRAADFISRHDPLAAFTETLRYHQRNGHNVVLSSEHLTSTLTNQPMYWRQEIFRNLLLSSFHHTRSNSSNPETTNEEPFFGFGVKVVVTYRHLFQWLPSYYNQRYGVTLNPKKNRPTYVPGIVEYVEAFLSDTTIYTDPSTADNNSYSSRLFSEEREDHRFSLPTYHGSIWSFSQWSSTPELHDRVDVFDMHQQKQQRQQFADENTTNGAAQPNLLADFVCQMLPSAPNTCRYLEEETSNDDFFFRKSTRGKRFVSLVDLTRIHQTAVEQERPSKIERVPATKLASRWLETQRRRNNTEDLKRCLSEERLEQLKSASRSFLVQQLLLVRRHNSHRREQKPVLSSLGLSSVFRSTRPTDHLVLGSQQEEHGTRITNRSSGAPWEASIKANHDALFDKHAASGIFCEIDVDRLFENESFLKFVFGSNAAK